jgi:hypothetical protein
LAGFSNWLTTPHANQYGTGRLTKINIPHQNLSGKTFYLHLLEIKIKRRAKIITVFPFTMAASSRQRFHYSGGAIKCLPLQGFIQIRLL